MAHRATHFNASDAPAMMGCSPYETRTQLIHRLSTGIAPEVDAATQRRFDDGHRFEALARPLAEEIIGEELYPVTGSEGKLSASFDGLTMGEDAAFEHKTLNDDLRACMNDQGNGYGLPKQYQVQMEQQLMVSGAERVLFMASKWNGDVLVEERHCWYASDPKLRAEIIAGWKQFAADLAAYIPPAVTVEAVGRAPETLPALHIEVTGMVTASNLAQFKDHALAVFGGINRTLTTDGEFADAEKTVKWCGDVEDRLAAAKQHALSQTESIDALFRTIDDISAEARKVRLELDKLVKARKEELRGEIVKNASDRFDEHHAALNMRIGRQLMPAIRTDFIGVIKGKRTLTSLHDAVDTELARAKIEASATADRIEANLKTLRELASGHAFLFADTAQIVLKAPDDLTMLVKSRIAEHQAAEAKKEADTRERIRAEEQAKAEREANAAMLRGLEESAQRMRDEEAAERRRIAEMPKEPAPTIITAIPEANAQIITSHASVANVVPMRHAQPAPATPPTLTLGAIGTRLGFNLTADFLKGLGFEATKVKASCLYHDAQFPDICTALMRHVGEVAAAHVLNNLKQTA